MRSRIMEYKAMKPIRTRGVLRAKSPRAWQWIFSPRIAASALVLFVCISSAGISSSAESALPGDLLYPIKTKINEPVAGVLAVSPSDKAAWAAAVSGERVQEAVTLAAAGRLSTSTQTELTSAFETHAQMAARSIATLAAADPTDGVESAVRYQAQLSEYADMLSQAAASHDTDVSPLVAAVVGESDRVAAAQESLSTASATSSQSATSTAAGADTAEVASQLRHAAQAQVAATIELSHQVTDSLSSSSADLVASQLDSASSSIKAGDELSSESALAGAIGAFKGALSASEALGVYLETSAQIHDRTGLVVGTQQFDQPAQQPVEQPMQALEAASVRSGQSTSTAPALSHRMRFAAAVTRPRVAKPAATSTNDASLSPISLHGAARSATSSIRRAHMDASQSLEISIVPTLPDTLVSPPGTTTAP